MPETTTSVATPRTRAGSVILTDRICEKRVTVRTKLYDRKCGGLYVSITTAGVATFSLKFTDPVTGKQRSGWLGVHGEAFTVADARAKVYALKGLGTAALAETFRNRKAQQAKAGKTVAEIIDERIAWMKTEVRKADGEMRPRLESWENTASHLNRFLRPRLGKKLASEVTKHDIAELSNDIVAGRHGGKPSIANARHMRRAASGLFNWAAEAGRDYVSTSPCVNLPKLDAEHPRTRVLSAEEIKTLWHGLDRADMPWDRRTQLALKFELVTMLRSSELLGAHRDELFDLDGKHPRFDVPLRRVKKRRTISQPLSSLAVEIICEALKGSNKDYVFASPLDNKPLNRKAMADALRGKKRKGGKVTAPRHLCAARPQALHAARPAPDGGKLGTSDRPADGEDFALSGSSCDDGGRHQAAARHR
jgi:integrase